KAIPPEYVEIYTEAMRATSALTHPAAIAFYDAFYEDGWLLLVQEAIQGQALSRYLRQGVPSERAVNLTLQLAHTLAYAQHRGVGGNRAWRAADARRCAPGTDTSRHPLYLPRHQ